MSSKKVLFLTSNAGVEHDELVKPLDFLKQQGIMCTHAAEQLQPVQTVKNDKEPSAQVQPDTLFDSLNIEEFDLIVLPGGTVNADLLRVNQQVKALIQQATDKHMTIAAICHAPWIMINAERIKGKKLTSYHSIQLDLQHAGGEWVDEAVVNCPANGFLLITSRCPDDIPQFNHAIYQTLTQ